VTESGGVLWLTGLSGAGKSTVADLCVAALRRAGEALLLLDGNEVREAVDDPAAGFCREGRLKAAARMSRLARLAARQGLIAVVPTISLFHEIQTWNRANLPSYVEVYLRVPLSEVEARDPRGLYAARRAGDSSPLWGIDIPIEEPREPDLLCDPERSARDTADLALALLWGKLGRGSPAPTAS
jgi:adenylylsulfate kinase-like enzyme